MPTTRPRYPITETAEISAALEAAAVRWPADRDRPRVLLLHLIAEGVRRIQADDAAQRAERRAAIEATSGSAGDLFAGDFLDELREDWPV